MISFFILITYTRNHLYRVKILFVYNNSKRLEWYANSFFELKEDFAFLEMFIKLSDCPSTETGVGCPWVE